MNVFKSGLNLPVIIKTSFVFMFLAVYVATANAAINHHSKIAAIKEPKSIYYEKNSNIHFPAAIAGLAYVNFIDYEKDYPGLGINIEYKNADITADIYIYNLKLATIGKEAIAAELENAKRDIYTLERSANYKNVEQVKNQPPQITVGDLNFDYAMFIYLAAGKMGYSPVVSEFFITSYKNNILKLRVTSFKENQQQAVDSFLLGLKSLLK